MKYICFIIFILSFIIAPASAFAYDLKVSPDISISENYIPDKNLYLASLHAWLNTNFEKDLVSASFDQTVGGTLFGDVILLGKKIEITGQTFNDVRTISDTINISGVINKDLIIVARNVNIESGAIINGDTLILAHTVDIQGQLLGQSQITGSNIFISGSIIGPTTLTGTKISFLSSSKVNSDISYFSPQRAYIENGAQIQGKINFNQIETIQQNEVVKRLFFGFVSFWALIKLIATLFVIFVLTHLFKIFSQNIIESVKNKNLEIFIWGLISFISIPFLILALFASLVLIPVAIIILCIYIIMIMLLPAISSIICASFYQNYFQKSSKINVDFRLSALVLMVITFISFIPYIGDYIIYFIYIVSFGAMVKYLYDNIRRKKIIF